MSTAAYPLQWPDGWPRTLINDRREGKYQFRRPGRSSPFWTFGAARDALIDEVRKLNGGGSLVISSNFRPDRSGSPTEGARRPPDQGVAIYFDLGGRQMAMARDFSACGLGRRRTRSTLRFAPRHGGRTRMRAAAAAPWPSSIARGMRR